jgi:hypothetical protein
LCSSVLNIVGPRQSFAEGLSGALSVSWLVTGGLVSGMVRHALVQAVTPGLLEIRFSSRWKSAFLEEQERHFSENAPRLRDNITKEERK